MDFLSLEPQWCLCGQGCLTTPTEKTQQLFLAIVITKGDEKIINVNNCYCQQNLRMVSIDLLAQVKQHLVKAMLDPCALLQTTANM